MVSLFHILSPFCPPLQLHGTVLQSGDLSASASLHHCEAVDLVQGLSSLSCHHLLLAHSTASQAEQQQQQQEAVSVESALERAGTEYVDAPSGLCTVPEAAGTAGGASLATADIRTVETEEAGQSGEEAGSSFFDAQDHPLSATLSGDSRQTNDFQSPREGWDSSYHFYPHWDAPLAFVLEEGDGGFLTGKAWELATFLPLSVQSGEADILRHQGIAMELKVMGGSSPSYSGTDCHVSTIGTYRRHGRIHICSQG